MTVASKFLSTMWCLEDSTIAGVAPPTHCHILHHRQRGAHLSQLDEDGQLGASRMSKILTLTVKVNRILNTGLGVSGNCLSAHGLVPPITCLIGHWRATRHKSVTVWHPSARAPLVP